MNSQNGSIFSSRYRGDFRGSPQQIIYIEYLLRTYCAKGDIRNFKKVFEILEDYNIPEKIAPTLLTNACLSSNLDLVKHLVELTKNIKFKRNDLLLLTCERQNLEIASYLFETPEIYGPISLKNLHEYSCQTWTFIMNLLGKKTFFADENSFIVDIERYVSFFNSNKIKIPPIKPPYFRRFENFYIYSKTGKVIEKLSKYEKILESVNKKSARK